MSESASKYNYKRNAVSRRQRFIVLRHQLIKNFNIIYLFQDKRLNNYPYHLFIPSHPRVGPTHEHHGSPQLDALSHQLRPYIRKALTRLTQSFQNNLCIIPVMEIIDLAGLSI